MAKDTKTIVLELELRELNLKNKIKSLKEEIGGLDKRFNTTKEKIKQLEVAERNLVTVQNSLSTSNNTLAGTSDNLNNKLSGATKSTGAATAASLELGRVFSDMPYGIRGVANNISQLASNVFFMTKKVDEVTGKALGFRGALKNIASSLAGPAGLLVAFQLLVAVFESLSNQKRTAIDLEKEYREEISKTLAVLKDVETFNSTMVNNSKMLVKLKQDLIDLEKDESATFEQKKKLRIDIIDLELTQLKIHKETVDGIRNQNEENKKNVDLLKEALDTNTKIYILERQRQRELRSEEVVVETKKKPTKSAKKEKMVDIDDFKKRLLDYKKRYLEYIENRRAIEAEIDIADAELNSFGVLNEIPRLSAEKEILDLKLAEDIQRIDFMIQARIQEGAAYADLESEKILMLRKSQQEQQKIDEKIAESKASTLSYVGDAMSAFSDLAGKESSVGKALAVATATIDTYVGANAALTDKTIPNTFARIAAVSAVIATGLANVKSILSVKTQGGGSAGSVPSAGRTFDFNLVGSTGVNQLAQTVGGQVNQPIKAYVVGSEITNQQAFDNQIQGQATIG